MHPVDRVAAGRPRAHRRDLQSGSPRQLRGRRDPRRPAHRLRPPHGDGRDQRHDHARGRRRLRGGAGAGRTSSTSWTSARCRTMRDAGAGGGRRRRRQPAPAARPGRSTISGCRSARSTRSRTRTSGRLERSGRVQRGRPAQGQERRREGAAARSPSCCEREGLNFGMAFEETTASCACSRPGVPPSGCSRGDRSGGERVMRHRAKGRQLSPHVEQKRALLRNMATSLFEHGRVDHHRGQGQGAAAVRREAHHPGAPRRPARAPAGRAGRSRSARRCAGCSARSARGSPRGPAATPASSRPATARATARRWRASSCSPSDRRLGVIGNKTRGP